MSECWCPHPRLPDRRGVYLEDAADNEAISDYVVRILRSVEVPIL
jgi:hypothetical protein